MRLLASVALLSSFAGAASLSGTLKSPADTPLAGATVSLAFAGFSTVTAVDGSWQLGGTTGLAPSGRADLRATRHLSVVNGRIKLNWNGRDIAGRVESRASMPKATAVPVSFAGRSAGAKVDTLVFAWRGERIGALPVDMDSVYDLRLRLDTLVAPAPQSVQVRTVRSRWDAMERLSVLLTSPGTTLKQTDTIKAIGQLTPQTVLQDSLTLRLFVRSKDTLTGTQYLMTNTGIVNVPLRFQNALAVRYDLCQAYDSAGYNKPCNDPVFGQSWSWGTLASAVQLLMPVRQEGSYERATQTWIYALDLPLGPTFLPVGGKVRFDILFSDRSPWPRAFSLGQKTDLEALTPYLPARALPSVGDTGWWDAYTGAAPHAFAAADSAAQSLDWSFKAHTVRNGSPVDFAGIAKAASSSEIETLLHFGGPSDLNPWTRLAPNPYICVYRKGKLVSGYPPVLGRD